MVALSVVDSWYTDCLLSRLHQQQVPIPAQDSYPTSSVGIGRPTIGRLGKR